MTLPNSISRLRMFAGPNGSGKTTIKSVIREELLGIYVNPDDIETEIRECKVLDVRKFRVQASEAEVFDFFRKSTLLEKANLLDQVENLIFAKNCFDFSSVSINSYFASVTADFLRQKLIALKISFTLETVMSSPSKVDLLRKSRKLGYRNYLYFVATNSPDINISRVKHRVKIGGHNVPTEKIVARYYRSLDLLWDAIKHTDRAYIFDNSGSKLLWLAEITGAEKLEIKTDSVPSWFEKYILDKSR